MDVGEPGANHHVGTTGEDGLDQRVNLGWIVLAVAVQEYEDIGIHPPRLLERGFDGGRLAEIVRVPNDCRARGFGHLGRRVGRAVVDNQDLARLSAEFQNEATDVPILVEGRYRNDNAVLSLF
jgi:hypothetical protein